MNRRRVFEHVFPLETAIAYAVFLLALCALLFSVVRRHARAEVASQRAERPGLEALYIATVPVRPAAREAGSL